MSGFEDLEDDIVIPEVQEIRNDQPRKLSRLKKKGAAENTNANAVKGIDTPESEARGAAGVAVLADEDNEPEVSLSVDAEAEQEEPNGDAGAAAGEGAAEEEVEAWDEEEELEQYYREKSARGGAAEDSLAASSGGDSDSEDDADYTAPALGDNPSLEELNAETQRILRETAARDRLGKGQKIEIKPLTGIVAKLKERRALAIARAPKPAALPSALPSFDDILAAAGDNAAPDAPAGAPPSTPTPDAVDADDDLEVVEDDGEADAQGVGLLPLEPPSAAKASKPSPLAFDPFTQSRDLDEFEDEPLIDDGVGSDDESDSESERSWEVRKEEEEAGEEAQGGSVEDKAEAVEVEEEEEGSSDVEMDVEEVDVEVPKAAEGEEAPAAAGEPGAAAAPAQPPSAIAVMLAAADAVPEREKRMQRRFLDTEAELSDEEGAAAAVSDDEDEDDVNDAGELADLITNDKTKTKDLQVTEEYHVQWRRQQDAKELQQVIRGLENGFRRRRPGGLDDLDAEMHGRLRRARFGEDEFEGGFAGAFAFPAGFCGPGAGAGDDEECEDEMMLEKAKKQRILAGSQQGVTSPGAVPLDEDSQAVLGLLARSESQQGGWMALMGSAGSGGPAAPPPPPPSRLAMEAGGLLRGPSFVGRAPAVRQGGGGGGGGLGGGGRSFVFGRSENSNSAIIAPEGDAAGGSGGDASVGPVSFANLRQMAGLPTAAGGAGGEGANSKRKRKQNAPTLVSRLKRQGSSLHESQESLNAVSAVCQTIAAGPRHR